MTNRLFVNLKCPFSLWFALFVLAMSLVGCTPSEVIRTWQAKLIAVREHEVEQRPLAVVLIHYEDYLSDIFLLRADGSDPLQVTYTPETEWYPQWSPDGTQLAFFTNEWSGDDILVELHIVSLTGNHSRQLIEPIIIKDTRWLNWLHLPLILGHIPIVWSPDGQQIVFEKPDGQLYVADVTSGGEAPLFSPDSTDFVYTGMPAWAPYGSQLAFTGVITGSEKSDIYLLSPDQTLFNVTETVTESVRMPAWAPSGTQLAFVGEQTLYMANADGSDLKALRSGLSAIQEFYQAPRWSPNGRYLLWGGAMGSGTGDLMLFDTVTSMMYENIASGTALQPTWSADSTFIAYTDVSDFSLKLLQIDDFSAVPANPKLPDSQNPVWRP